VQVSSGFVAAAPLRQTQALTDMLSVRSDDQGRRRAEVCERAGEGRMVVEEE
jgi:hypothetical protein